MAHAETPNYTLGLLSRFRQLGDRDAIVMEDQRVSGTLAHDLVLRYATALRDSGLRPGDGVAIFFARNCPDVILLQLAIHFAGGRMVFVTPEPADRELAAFVRQAEIQALLFDPAFEDRARYLTGQVAIPRVYGIGATALAPDFLATVPDRPGLTADDAAGRDHVATVMYTGGTTGRPKLVTHRARYYDGLTLASAFYLDGDDRPADARTLVCSLLTHALAHNAWAITALAGGTVVLLRTFDADAALSVMDRERITSVALVTPMLYELLDRPGWPAGSFPALRDIFYTGAPAAPSRLAEAIKRFGPVLDQSYGSTENSTITRLLPSEHDLTRPELLASCGRRAPGVEIEIRDEDGKPAPDGAVGEIHVRGPMTMDGYWNDPERTAEVLDDDGWFRTGDLGRAGQDGYFYIVGRARDVIISGITAENVHSRLLDDFLISLPDVKDAAAVGLPDQDNRETIHVVLVPREPSGDWDPGRLARLTQQVTDALGGVYAPASYSIAESLPRTAVGKVDKKALRKALLDAAGLAFPQGGDGNDH